MLMELVEMVTPTIKDILSFMHHFFSDWFLYFVVSKSMKDCVSFIWLELWFLLKIWCANFAYMSAFCQQSSRVAAIIF